MLSTKEEIKHFIEANKVTDDEYHVTSFGVVFDGSASLKRMGLGRLPFAFLAVGGDLDISGNSLRSEDLLSLPKVILGDLNIEDNLIHCHKNLNDVEIGGELLCRYNPISFRQKDI